MESMLLPIVLLVIGLLLIGLELFIPSAGTIGIVATIVIFVAVVMAFFVDVKQGFIFLLVTSILVPVVMVGLVRIWPYTPMGKRMLGDLPTAEDVIADPDRLAELKSLVGKQGVARSKMLPSGVIRIDGKNYDAVSSGQAVEEGQKVIVTAIKTNRIIVRPVTTIALDPKNEESILAQSPESLGIDPIDDPLGASDVAPDGPTIEDPFS